jgi:Tfp pilus assembly protein PilF
MSHRMICKEYKSGDVLCRTKTQADFLGIIQRGEIVVEYRTNGSVIHYARFHAGDRLRLRSMKGVNKNLVVLARAVTDVRLCILHSEAEVNLRSKWLVPDDVTRVSAPRWNQRVPWQRYWAVFVAILIIFLTRNDASRILSGILYLSAQTRQSPYDSIPLLRDAEFFDRGAVFAHNQEGYAWIQANDLRRAGTAFVNAIHIDPTNGPALNNLAVTYFVVGQSKLAVDLQQRAVQSDPDSAVVHYNLGLILMKQQSNAEAIREFKEASYIDPTWVLPYIQKAFLYIQLQDYIDAESVSKEAIRLDPSQRSVHLILAIALYNQDKNPEALRSVENVLQIDSDDVIARFYEARILNNLGENNMASSILQQLLKSANAPPQITRFAAEIEALHRSLLNIPTGAR